MNYLKDILLYIVISMIILGIYFSLPIVHDPLFAIWILVVFSLFYLPYVFIRHYAPREMIPEFEYEKTIIDNDIAHFREVVKKALNENAVAQREVELKILEIVSMELSLRYEIPENVIRSNMGNEKFLQRYFGKSGIIVARMFRRRHELSLKIPRDRFLKEIEMVMEAMR